MNVIGESMNDETSKKDLVIGVATNYEWDVLRYWVNSIKSTDFSGDVVLMLGKTSAETKEKLKEKGVIIVDIVEPQSIPIHVARFSYMWQFLLSHPDYRYVITTDVRDVVFQRNPSKWLENNLVFEKIVAGSESMRYKNEPWGDDNLRNAIGADLYELHFKNNIIYNVGVLGGHAEYMRDLFLNLFVVSTNRPIPIVDQAMFNFLINQKPYSEICKFAASEDAWAAQLGTTGDPRKMNFFKPKLLEPQPEWDYFKDALVTVGMKEVFTIVHQYDRVPELRAILEKKYA
jgi:hypothetical protein